MAGDGRQLMTAEELRAVPRGTARHELIRGELRTMPLHFAEHGFVTAQVLGALHRTLHPRRGELLPNVGFILERAPDTVRAPDLAFVRHERVAKLADPWGYVPGPPDIAVEVLSPDELAAEVADKTADWLRHGTSLVLVVHVSRRTLLVHRPGQSLRELGQGDTLDGADVVRGWHLPVSELFTA